MKKITALLILLLTLATCYLSQAQEFRPVEQSYSTSTEKVTIAGKQFDGGYSKSGSIYIIRISAKTKEPYKAYLGQRTDKDYNDKPVWTNKDKTAYWYFIIDDKSGYPKRIYLEPIKTS